MTTKPKFWREVIDLSYVGPFGPPMPLMFPIATVAVAIVRVHEKIAPLLRK